MNDSIAPRHTDRKKLQQIIVGLAEGVIIINPDQTIAWANKAALAMHGVQSVEDLGATVSEYRRRFELRYRNRHKLPPGNYPMDRVVAGEAFTEVTVEVGRPGEAKHWVHRIRCLVLTDPEGQPDCLVLILEDETDRVSAEERFEQAFGANPAPALIVRLSDMRYVKVNQGFLQMMDCPREALIGRSIHEIDLLERAQKRELAVERLHAGATIPQMEACLKISQGALKTVVLAGQPIAMANEACMLFTFADLHPRQQAEDALRHSEERFAKAFRMAPMPMAIIALKGLRILDVNDGFTTATGWRPEEAIGRGERELALWGHGAARDQLEQQIKQTGRLHEVDIQLQHKDGSTGMFLLSAETVTIHSEPCVLSVMLDITERRHTEAQLLAAIEAVLQDTSWLGQKIVEQLSSLTRKVKPAAQGPTVSDLTTRARDVLDLIAQGLSDAEIATELAITRNTTRNHVSAIYKALNAHRRSDVVIWARERGLGTKPKPLISTTKSRKRRRL